MSPESHNHNLVVHPYLQLQEVLELPPPISPPLPLITGAHLAHQCAKLPGRPWPTPHLARIPWPAHSHQAQEASTRSLPHPGRPRRHWPTLCPTSVCKSLHLTLIFFSSYLTICNVLAEAASCHSLSGFHSCSALEVSSKLLIWRRHLKDHKNVATLTVLQNPPFPNCSIWRKRLMKYWEWSLVGELHEVDFW